MTEMSARFILRNYARNNFFSKSSNLLSKLFGYVKYIFTNKQQQTNKQTKQSRIH